MQDRVLNVTVLVPAKADTEIPVSCVEHGRWNYRSGRRFDASPEFSPSTLRAIKIAAVSARRRSVGDHRSDQGRVWAEVARKHAMLGSSSPTGAMRDAYEQRASDLEAMTRSFGRPLPEQTGVVVTVGGRAVAFDGFDKPETLARLWPRLVRGYAMEALGEPERHAEREIAERFVAAIGSAKATAHDAVGLGTEVVLTSRASSPARSSGKARWSTSPRSPTRPSDRARARAITSRVDRGSAIGTATVLDRRVGSDRTPVRVRPSSYRWPC